MALLAKEQEYYTTTKKNEDSNTLTQIDWYVCYIVELKINVRLHRRCDNYVLEHTNKTIHLCAYTCVYMLPERIYKDIYWTHNKD